MAQKYHTPGISDELFSGIMDLGSEVFEEVADKFTGDLNASLRISDFASGGGATGFQDSSIIINQLAEYEESDTTGVAVTVDLKKWASDPFGYPIEFGKNVLGTRGILNFDDYWRNEQRKAYNLMLTNPEKLIDQLGEYEPFWAGLIKRTIPYGEDDYELSASILTNGLRARYKEEDPDIALLDESPSATVVVDDEDGVTHGIVVRDATEADDPSSVVNIVQDTSDEGGPYVTVDTGQRDSVVIVADNILDTPRDRDIEITKVSAVYEKDLLQDVASNMDGFIKNSESFLFRDSSFRSFQSSVFNYYREAVAPGHRGISGRYDTEIRKYNLELDQKRAKLATLDPAQHQDKIDKLESRIDELETLIPEREEFYRSALGKIGTDAPGLPMDSQVRAFVLKADFADITTQIDSNLNDISKGLATFVNRGGDGRMIKVGDDQKFVGNGVYKLEGGLKNLQDNAAMLFGGPMGSSDVTIPRGESLLEKIKATYGADSDEFREFESSIRPLRDFLYGKKSEDSSKGPIWDKGAATKISNKVASDGKTIPIWERDSKGTYLLAKNLNSVGTKSLLIKQKELANLRAFMGEINIMKKKLNGGFGSNGPLSKVLNHLEAEVSNPNSAINKYIKAGSASIKSSENVRWIMTRMRRKREWEFNEEILQQLSASKLANYVFWLDGLKLRDRLMLYTAGYAVDELFLKRAHYFGLKVQDKEKVKTFKWADNLIEKLPWVFSNKFTLAFDGISASVAGGAHFAAAIQLKGLFSKGAFNGSLNELGKITFTDGGDFFGKLLKAENFEEFKRLWVELGVDIPGFNSADKLKEFFDSLQNFKNYLRKNPVLRKVFFNPDGSFKLEAAGKFTAMLDKLFEMQSKPYFTDITKVSIGVLEKLTIKASMIQKRLFDALDKIPGGTVIKRYVTLKTALSEAIASGITGILASVTGGVLAPVSGILERVIGVATRWVVDQVDNFRKAIFKGDIGKFFSGLEETFTNAIKFMGIVAAVIATMAFILMIPVMTIVGAIKQDNNSKGRGSNAGGYGPTGPGGLTGGCQTTTNTNGCVLVNGARTAASFSDNASGEAPAGNETGHGSTTYYNWVIANTNASACQFSIPFAFGSSFAIRGPTTALDTADDNYCNPEFSGTPPADRDPVSASEAGPWFGRAVDYGPTAGNLDDVCVFVPAVTGIDRWTVSGVDASISGGTGYTVLLTGLDNSGVKRNELTLTHLEQVAVSVGDTVEVGQIVAENLYSGPAWSPHVHIELARTDGAGNPVEILQPENFVCN